MMKKLIMLFLLISAVGTLSACDIGKKDDPNDPYVDPNDPNDPNDPWTQGDCQGHHNYVIIEGQCIILPDIVSGNVDMNGDEVISYMNSVELMTDFVADLSGSKGLAVVSKDVFEQNNEDSVNLAAMETEDTDNIIVKLTEDGFFEEVSFTDDTGLSVEIKSNPLALEVFGEFTVVAFEVDTGYNDPNQEFTQKLWDSLYSGGIYLIHNETGKLFATKQVEYQEHTWTEWQDHSRTALIQVTLGEPVVEIFQEKVVDEFGNPVLDADGNEQFTTIENPLTDKDGNPVIFNEGPVMMETIEVPVMEWVEQDVLDENGDPVTDDDGNVVKETVQVPVLDENGNPKVDIETRPMLDENGDPVYQQQFEVEIFIEDQREITHIEYSAHVQDNPLSQLAQRFVDKIVAEYYNWNYYRVNNNRIEHHSFVYNNGGIFYIEWQHVDGSSENTSMLKKVAFDSEFLEVTIEDYLNLTKAGFTECELLMDPEQNIVICDSWNSNIKIYSDTYGLVTIPDSDTLQPVSFPNGELFFFDSQEEYVEELGYFTTALYRISADGTLQENFIELGERDEVCYGECNFGVSVDLYTADGEMYQDNHWVDMMMSNGSPVFERSDLVLTDVGEFDATRPECTDSNGCWYDIVYELLDDTGTVMMKVYGSDNYYPGDTPPNYVERYVMNEGVVIEYQQQWSDYDQVCDNEIGCTNNFRIVDENINQNGLWIHDNTIVAQGETFLEEIRIKDTTTVTYEYDKYMQSEVCEYETGCTTYVNIHFYDIDGELLYQTNQERQYAQDEMIPLHIDYHITQDTNVVYKTGVCTNTEGCWEWYNTEDWIGYGITYDRDEMMYHSIEFVESDITPVYEETLTREACTEVDGCWGNEAVYEVLDDSGNVLYTFEANPHVEYGYKVPFKATVTLSDCESYNKKEYVDEDRICNESFCNSGVSVQLDIGETENVELGWGNMTVAQGEKMISRIILNPAAFDSSVAERVCMQEDGCFAHTENFTLVDADGVERQREYEDWKPSLPVYFAYGETVPHWEDNQFEATFLIQNEEYRRYRINIHEFIYRMQEIVVLDDNLYLLERDAWQQGEDNFILTFNEETDRYSIKFTNISAVLEITDFETGYIAINDDETAIIQFAYNSEMSNDDYYYFDQTNLTEGLLINGVNDLIVDFDGSIYFKGVDNFIQDITGSILEDGTVQIDTEIVEREVIRVRPIN